MPIAPKRPAIQMKPETDKSFKFTFEDEHTKIIGRVSVWLGDNRPDQRTLGEKEAMAKKRIAALIDRFAKAIAEEF